VLRGDINKDFYVNLLDTIISLRLLSGEDVNSHIREDYDVPGVDVSGANQIGLEEAIYILKTISTN
jgi:hypothetical protein